MFRTKLTRSLTIFGTSAAVGVGSLWGMTGNLTKSIAFYAVSSIIFGGAFAACVAGHAWISKGE